MHKKKRRFCRRFFNIQKIKKQGCSFGTILLFWLGRRDSDPRDAGVKVLCLTAWPRPNMLIVKTPTAFNYGRINFKWGGGWDSNPRSSEPQSDALGQLRYIHHVRQFKKLPGAPWGTRTPGPLLRRQMLYPAELTAHFWSGWGESNPPIQLGRLAFYQWITSA